MKRILIDGTTISPKTDGLSQYILNIAARLDISSVAWTILVRPIVAALPEVVRLKERMQVIEADIAPIGIKRDIQFAKWLWTHQKEYDAILYPSNQYPWGNRIPTAYVIHDLIYEEFPQQLGRLQPLKRFWLRRVVRRGLKKADKVICVSSYTQSEVIRIHGAYFTSKMVVVGEGAEHLDAFNTHIPTEKGKYLVYIGSSRGHKNILRLLQAVQQVQSTLKENGWKLLIIGDTCFYGKTEQQLMHDLGDTLQTTGWLPTEDVNRILAEAGALIFPSLSEGFGIPLVEAFYYDVPVLCSKRASLPEVAGNAALYFNPLDVNDIADKIVEFITTPSMASKLAMAGRKRLQKYSWKQAAAKISHIMQTLVE